ncbi:2OG-Fe(II) oxygenase [Luteimonas sp. SX5]|uniref:2OG-Fe(II) oxygenase n=1 Tax=Luteimonas galliterrae TaxID=2940486 RepID=A0ABT0MET2_9GAMM|nr:2OG-Fe(II) oxygenase [Luteimonas galliterrae]MCL1633103.1 2OG-Fe(II) oxygenase [Luteimonas galliterrae]
MTALPEVDAAQRQAPAAMAEALADRGACRIVGMPARWPALRSDLLRLRDEGALQAASVGRDRTRALRPDVRGDSTLWLHDPRCGDAARDFLAELDALRGELNQRLYLGLHEVEAHYAAYPPGSGYARHRDRFRDDDARVLSWVSYLNEGWNESDGGALRVLTDDGQVDVTPLGGTSVCFLSELEHEVLPAARERLSIAAWFRR